MTGLLNTLSLEIRYRCLMAVLLPIRLAPRSSFLSGLEFI